MAARDTLARAKRDPRWPTFRRFCDLSRRPSRDVVRISGTDLRALPRVGRFLAGPEWNADALAQASAEFVDHATRELLGGLDRRQLRSSPVWIVRQNNVHGEILDALVDRARDRRGRRYGIEQIKKMKQLGIAELFEWASRPASNPSGSTPRVRRRRRSQRLLMGLVATVAVVALGMILVGRSPRPQDGPSDLSTYAEFEQRRLRMTEVASVFAELGVRAKPHPSLPFAPSAWTLVPPVGGHGPRALFRANVTDDTPGGLALWDPTESELSWVLDFVPPREQMRTHATLDDDVYRSPFTAGQIVFGAGLPDRIGVSYCNRFSPCFFLQVRLEDGAVLSQYVHPGRLESGLVDDIDGDGQFEFVLAGQENVLARPVLVVLEPDSDDGSASTVLWKQSTSREDARLRLVLPGSPSLEDALGVPRLRPGRIGHASWIPSMGILRVPVWADGIGHVYDIELDRRFAPLGISVGEAAARTWLRAGLDPDAAEDYLSPSYVIEGAAPDATGSATALGAQ
jgi:hypothetical protein